MARAPDQRRAAGPADRGRGPGANDADSPWQFSAAGWRRVLRRVLRHVLTDRLMVQSAGVAFFAVLSIAPVLVTALSIYGVANTPEEARQELSDAAGMLPPELRSVLTDQLTSITAASTRVLTWRGLTGLLVALSTATTAMTYLIDGLTLAYRETETRGFLRRGALALLFVLGGAVLIAGLIAAASVVSIALARAPAQVRVVGSMASWVALALVVGLVLAVLYRFGPDRKQARWRWITAGSCVATSTWLATTVGFFAYVQGLGSYQSTYGSLAGVAISMFWLWATVFIVIIGAAVNAEAERETVRDSTIGPEQPAGGRGAVVADSTPPYPGE